MKPGSLIRALAPEGPRDSPYVSRGTVGELVTTEKHGDTTWHLAQWAIPANVDGSVDTLSSANGDRGRWYVRTKATKREPRDPGVNP